MNEKIKKMTKEDVAKVVVECLGEDTEVLEVEMPKYNNVVVVRVKCGMVYLDQIVELGERFGDEQIGIASGVNILEFYITRNI